jgi:hypothetical protein
MVANPVLRKEVSLNGIPKPNKCATLSLELYAWEGLVRVVGEANLMELYLGSDVLTRPKPNKIIQYPSPLEKSFFY